jgi:hypothetical protein
MQIRRAESFHHSRSLGDFDNLTRDSSSPEPTSMSSRSMIQDWDDRRGQSVERLLAESHEAAADKASRIKLPKSKSMEFLKAKLLSRKPSTKATAPPPQHNHGPLDPRLYPPGQQRAIFEGQRPKQYDWRQDTPFWNGNGKAMKAGGKPQVPANKPKIREDAWSQLHGPSTTSLWPGHGQQQPYPGLFLGRKAGVPGGGNFYPSFNVGNGKNSSNVSRNVVMTGPQRPNPPQFVAMAHPAFIAAAAAAQAAAVIQQLAAAKNKQPLPAVTSDSLKDRLEITELSDGEEDYLVHQHQQEVEPVLNLPAIPSPDYRSPSETSGGRRSSASSISNHHGKILDLPSGLY